MADVVLDRSIGDALLKDVYGDAIVSSLNQGTEFLSEVQMDSKGVSGRKVIIAARLGRNTSFGSRPDGQNITLPRAKTSKVRQLEAFQTYHYSTLIITLPMIASMKSDEGAFGTAVAEQVDSVTETSREEFDRMLVRNDSLGRGILGVLDDSTSAVNLLPLTAAATDLSNAHTLLVDEDIDIVDVTDDTVLATERTITDVDYDSEGIPTHITISGAAVDTADGNKRVVRSGSWKNETIGLEGLNSSTGSLFGLDPVADSVPAWASRQHDAGGDPISELIIQRALDVTDIFTGAQGESGIRILMSHRQTTNLADLLKSSKRFMDTVELKAGYRVDNYLGKYPILRDKFVPETKVYINNHNHLRFAQSADWDWVKDGGGAILHYVPKSPNFEATLMKFGQFVTDRRNAHSKIINLSRDAA